jgi:prepilin-type N-terminal cleavage/methylation domain-containing protein
MKRAFRGFTLVELMAVVAIVAVLATVAVFSYKRYMRRARVVEGSAFLMDIKLKQETNFMTYSQYVSTGADENAFMPDSSVFQPDAVPYSWTMWSCTPPTAGYAAWCQLGITPTSDLTYFQYVTMGWTPGIAYDPTTGGYIRDRTRRWWFARARTYPTNSAAVTLELRLSSEIPQVVEIEGP